MQPADDDPYFFSFLTNKLHNKQIKCGMTYTNDAVHKIISENISKSAMYSGNIKGVGPRYCPAIEDKIVKFKDKEKHQIFLEPEGLKEILSIQMAYQPLSQKRFRSKYWLKSRV